MARLEDEKLQWRTIRVPTDDGGLSARVITTPSGNGTPAVLIHGGPGTPSDYLEPLAELARERPVVLYDQIGCGASDQPKNDDVWQVATFVSHLEAVRQFFEFETIHLYGHSWGGFLVLSYAEKYANRLSSITLASPLVNVATWVADATVLIQQLPKTLQTAIDSGPTHHAYDEAEAEFYARHFCSLDPWPEELQRATDKQDVRSYETMWGPNEFTQTGNLRDASVEHVIATLTVPQLWITGEQDEARPETIRGFSEQAQSSELIVIQDATHCAHLEHPENYMSAVSTFWAKQELIKGD